MSKYKPVIQEEFFSALFGAALWCLTMWAWSFTWDIPGWGYILAAMTGADFACERVRVKKALTP